MSLSTPHRFIEFAIQHQVLRFGEFTLKSGRKSPYFFNAGMFNTGKALAELGRFYAETIQASGLEFDILFGPAYKGISLATATAIALAHHYQRDVPFAFNRKEIKDHGEGGNMIGKPLQGNILLIDDVITAGTTFFETLNLMEKYPAKLCGIIIAFDRQEQRERSNTSAAQEINQQYHLPILSICNLEDLQAYISQTPAMHQFIQPLDEYSAQYGTTTK